MSWFKVDDKSWGHSKVVAAGNAAWGAMCRLGAYASDHLTDGKIPEHVAKLIATEDEIKKLLSTGLLDQNSDGFFEIHDFLDWNPSARQVTKLRKDRAKAGAFGGKQSAKQKRSKVQAKSKHLLDACLPFASDMFEAKLNPVPSRPVPIPTQDLRKENRAEAEQARPLLLDASKPKPAESVSSQAKEVFDHYLAGRRKTFPKSTGATFTPQRAKLISARLAEGRSVDELKTACDGLWLSDFHTGRDPKTNGKKYIDPELLFRDAKHVEDFIETATLGQRDTPRSLPSEPVAVPATPEEIELMKKFTTKIRPRTELTFPDDLFAEESK